MPKLLKLPAKIDRRLKAYKTASDALIEAQTWINFYSVNLHDIQETVNRIADDNGL